MFLPGAIALWVAFFALVASTYFYFRSLRGNTVARAWDRQVYRFRMTVGMIASWGALYHILTHYFRLHYVFSYSDLSLPTHYLISTFWAGQEGSFLLWLLCGVIVGLPLIPFAPHYEKR